MLSNACIISHHASCFVVDCKCKCHQDIPIREIPSHKFSSQILIGLTRYKDHHIKPGGFLSAVLENNLYRAISQADESSVHSLPEILKWCTNNLVPNSWGSPERVAKWVEQTRPNGE